MIARKRILCCIGTRPEAIKMAPVILALRPMPWADCRVLGTGQHRELLDQAVDFFGIAPDVDLAVMTQNQSLPSLTARLLTAMDLALADEKPELVLAQGDTTSVLAAALACLYRKIPFGHVEAGLRTGNLHCPFPEEANRVLAGHLAALHFAPTAAARKNLLKENIPDSDIHVVGNTVVDALLLAVTRTVPIGVDLDPARRLVLVTAHRRENHGEPMSGICDALAALAQEHRDVQFLWPVHPTPAVHQMVTTRLGHVKGIHLCPPLAYGALASAIQRACLILTDSGGLQEEAVALGKPVLVMRDHTERTEGVQEGLARLVGTHPGRIREEVSRLLSEMERHQWQPRQTHLYGDGTAGSRIAEIIGKFLRVSHSPATPTEPRISLTFPGTTTGTTRPG